MSTAIMSLPRGSRPSLSQRAFRSHLAMSVLNLANRPCLQPLSLLTIYTVNVDFLFSYYVVLTSPVAYIIFETPPEKETTIILAVIEM